MPLTQILNTQQQYQGDKNYHFSQVPLLFVKSTSFKTYFSLLFSHFNGFFATK